MASAGFARQCPCALQSAHPSQPFAVSQIGVSRERSGNFPITPDSKTPSLKKTFEVGFGTTAGRQPFHGPVYHFARASAADGESKKSVLQSRRPQPLPSGIREPQEAPPLFVLDEGVPRRRADNRLTQQEEDEASSSSGLVLEAGAQHRSGYVAIIGRPNAGKSTLLNQLIGQKISIVSQKPQTTRHRILGICSGRDYQMVLYDTPGVMARRMHKLDEAMMHNVRAAAVSADCIVLVVDITLGPEEVVDMLEEASAAAAEKRPFLVVLNKKDLLRPGEIAKKVEWYEAHSKAEAVVPVSAKYGYGCSELRRWAIAKLPLGPAYYPKDIVSEHPERFFVAEIVREKILLQYEREIPYACQVNVVRYIERPRPLKHHIEVEIVVERESQKPILLGKEGKAMRTLATAARLDIEDFVGHPVWLEVVVKVADKWRQNEKLIQEYGIDGRKHF